MHIVALIANIVALSVAIIWAAKTSAYDAILAVITLAGTLPLALKNSVEKFTAEAVRRLEPPCDFVLLGKVNTGKTVYLITAINLLLHESKDMSLLIKDQRSIEKVLSMYRRLTARQWINRTSSGDDNTITGTLRKKGRFGGSSESEAKFIDLPGEEFHQLVQPYQPSEGWIHETAVFRAALRSRFVFLFVAPDCEDIYDYVAALQVLAASLPLSRSGRIAKAICIVFSKSDLIPDATDRDRIIRIAKPLLATCERLAAAHSYFFVSCTGKLVDDIPPDPLAHENVLAPIYWCLKQRTL